MTSDLHRLLGFPRRASPRAAWSLLVTGILGALMTPAIAYTGMRMMDAIVAGAEHGAALWIFAETVLMVLLAVVDSLQRDAARLLKGPLGFELSSALALKLSQTDPCDLESVSQRERISRARKTAETRAHDFVVDALSVGQGVLSLLICAVMLLRFSAWSLVLVAAALPVAGAEVWCARALYRIRVRTSPDRRRFDHLEQNLLSVPYATENRFLDASPKLVGRLRELGARACAEEVTLWRRSGAVIGLAQLLTPITFYGFYAYWAWEAAFGRMTLGALTLCLVSFSYAQRFCQKALMAGRGAKESWLHLKDYLALIEGPVERPVVVPAAVITQRPSRGEGLRLENVGFRYPGSESWALRHISVEIGRGELIAIIGGNGSGKTTLLRLMTGLYRPTEGRILLDGCDLREWEPSSLRRRFAVVFQDFVRYEMSLKENMGLQPGISDHHLSQAFARSGVDEFITELPRGADTELSRSFGDGVELSGGQWQKVALARAFVRDHADFLLMDEPTSALHELSEQRVFEHLAEMRPDRTVILITHRLSALGMADRVLVLERGSMVRIEAHEALGPATPLRRRRDASSAVG
jgi:ATP-binding cassette, subfamily B, bacterial